MATPPSGQSTIRFATPQPDGRPVHGQIRATTRSQRRQVLGHIPAKRCVSTIPGIDFENRNDKPRPMQKHINSGKTKQPDRTLLGKSHWAEL
jgi:hypothetical protein